MINRNIGEANSLVVKGNPRLYLKAINSHGVLTKIRQAQVCTCATENASSPNMFCELCRGNGFIYHYQRSFFVADELSPCNYDCTEIYPHRYPILEPVKVQRIVSDIQGGIVDMPITGFSEDKIFVKNEVNAKQYEYKRTSYFFDGWTKVEKDILQVDEKNKLMFPTKTKKDLGTSSSNPYRATADICEVLRVYNIKTGKDIPYKTNGLFFETSAKVINGEIAADYYFADLFQVASTEISSSNPNEEFTKELINGETKFILYPWHNLSKGDILTSAAAVFYKNEIVMRSESDIDQLQELEPYDITEWIYSSGGTKHIRGIDFVLYGRFVKWISKNRPNKGESFSLRYGYRPTFIVSDMNPQPNSAENKTFPIILYAKSWTKTNSKEIFELIGGNK